MSRRNDPDPPHGMVLVIAFVLVILVAMFFAMIASGQEVTRLPWGSTTHQVMDTLRRHHRSVEIDTSKPGDIVIIANDGLTHYAYHVSATHGLWARTIDRRHAKATEGRQWAEMTEAAWSTDTTATVIPTCDSTGHATVVAILWRLP